MIIYNNELFNSSYPISRTKNPSQLESPLKLGHHSGRNHYRKTAGSSVKRKRDQIDPMDLIGALNEKSVDIIDKNHQSWISK